VLWWQVAAEAEEQNLLTAQKPEDCKIPQRSPLQRLLGGASACWHGCIASRVKPPVLCCAVLCCAVLDDFASTQPHRTHIMEVLGFLHANNGPSICCLNRSLKFKRPMLWRAQLPPGPAVGSTSCNEVKSFACSVQHQYLHQYLHEYNICSKLVSLG